MKKFGEYMNEIALASQPGGITPVSPATVVDTSPQINPAADANNFRMRQTIQRRLDWLKTEIAKVPMSRQVKVQMLAKFIQDMETTLGIDLAQVRRAQQMANRQIASA